MAWMARRRLRIASWEVDIFDPWKWTAGTLKKKHNPFLETEKKIIFHPPPTSIFGFKILNFHTLDFESLVFGLVTFFGGSSRLFFPDIYPNTKKHMEFPSTNLDRTHQWYLGPWRVVHLENLPWSFAFSDGFFSRSVRICTSLSWSQAFQGTNISAYFHSPKHTPEI